MRPVRYVVVKLGPEWLVWDYKLDLPVSNANARDVAKAIARKLESERVRDYVD